MTQLSAEDFHQRYVGTFIRHIQPDKKYSLIHVDHVHINSNNHNNGLLEVTSINSGSASLKYPTCAESLDLSQPNPGYFNLASYALYLFKYPDRQWRRGITGKNSELCNPLQSVLPDLHIYCPTIGFKSVEALFEKNFCPTIELALEALNKTHMSIALSSKLMLSLSPTTDTSVLLWWGCTPVGKLVNQAFQICDPTFEQEVFDEFRNLGINRQWMSF